MNMYSWIDLPKAKQSDSAKCSSFKLLLNWDKKLGFDGICIFRHSLEVIFVKLYEVTASERKVSWGQQFWPIRNSFAFREFSQDYPICCPPPALGSTWSTGSHNHQTSDYLASVWCKELNDGGLCVWGKIREISESFVNETEWICQNYVKGHIMGVF